MVGVYNLLPWCFNIVFYFKKGIVNAIVGRLTNGKIQVTLGSETLIHMHELYKPSGS